MSIARSQYGSTALKNERAAATRFPAPLPTPAAPRTLPVAMPRRHEQSLWLLLIVAAALFAGIMGVVYLSSYAALAREAYRRVHLHAQLQAEMDKSTQFQQIKAKINTSEYIEKKARLLGMAPARDRDMFIVGPPR